MRARLVLGAALLLRIALAATPGYAGDRAVFEQWAIVLARDGPLAIYGPSVTPAVDYAPGYLYALWAVGTLHAAIGGGDTTWRILLEIVPIGGDLALLWVLYRVAFRLTSKRSATILLAVAAFAPPLWIDSALFGQADAIPIVLALIALTAALDSRLVASWSSLAVAFIIKPLVIALAPTIAMLHVRSKTLWRSAAISIAAMLAIAYVSTLPFTTQRAPIAVFHFLFERYVNGANKAPHATEGAFSIYPLITGFFASDATRYGPLPLATWGLILVTIAIAASTITLAKSLAANAPDQVRTARVLGAATLSMLSLFLFATRMHERYLLPALILGAPLALDDPPTAYALTWLAISFTINSIFTLQHFTGGTHHPLTITLGRACCALNVFAFITLWQRQTKRLSNAPSSGAPH